MYDIVNIESIGGAIVGAIATIITAYFTLRGQIKATKVDSRKTDNEFILELQRQISAEREQMNEQRLQDSKAIGENMAMITSLQQEMNQMRTEIGDWRTKYFDLSEKYNHLQNEYTELQKKFSNLKGQLTQIRNKN